MIRLKLRHDVMVIGAYLRSRISG